MTKNLITALQAWHEAAKRPGVLSRDGWKVAVQFRRAVAAYFLSMASAINLSHIADNDYGHIEPHLRHVMVQAQPLILSAYKVYAKLAWDIAAKQPVYTGGQLYPVQEAQTTASTAFTTDDTDKLLAALDRLGLTGKAAVDYIAAHGAELVVGLDDYTLKVMQSIISQGVEDQIGVQGIVKNIRAEFSSMSGSRAKSIAATETNDAFSEVALRKIEAVGLDGKRWIRSPGACPICVGNASQGIIPLNQAFVSGHQRPPAHPGKCRCAVAGARLVSAASFDATKNVGKF